MNNYKPHLATDVDVTKLEFPIFAEYKVDGVRMEIQNCVATGRSMKKYKNKKLTEYFSKDCFNGFSMEVVTTYVNDQDLCRLTTSQVNTIEGNLPNAVVVFDYLTPETITMPYKERKEALKNYLETVALPTEVKIIFSESHQINSLEELEDFYTKALENNYEGVIIRKLEGLHKNGRCTVKEGNYLRLKPTGDSEGIVLSVEEAYENTNEVKINELGYSERSTHQENMIPKGMIGSLWVKDVHSGEVVKIGAGKLTHEDRKYYFENQDEIIGELVKYAFLATGKKDKPRHPRYISHRAKEDMG